MFYDTFKGASCLPDHETDLRHVTRFESADVIRAAVSQMEEVICRVPMYVAFIPPCIIPELRQKMNGKLKATSHRYKT